MTADTGYLPLVVHITACQDKHNWNRLSCLSCDTCVVIQDFFPVCALGEGLFRKSIPSKSFLISSSLFEGASKACLAVQGSPERPGRVADSGNGA